MYQVSFRRNIPGAGWTTVNRPPNTPNYLMTGLLPETEYEVMVRTLCGTIRVPYPPSLYFTTHPNTRKGESKAESLSMTVYPNPTRGTFTVYVRGLSEGKTRMSIYDGLGRKVYTEAYATSAGETALSVDLAGSLSKGVYLLTVESGDALRTERLVVE
jgi:hypothetical protein